MDLSPKFFNTGNNDETFQQCGNQDFFRHILKSPASMYDSASLYWRVKLFYSSGGSFKQPREFNQDQVPLMNHGWLWTWVTGILCNFRLALQKKRGKEISRLKTRFESSRSEFLRLLANNFALSDA